MSSTHFKSTATVKVVLDEPYRYMTHPQFTSTCHFSGVEGYIRPYCRKLENQKRKNSSFAPKVKTKKV